MITCRLAGLTVAATPRHPYYARLMRDYLAPDGAVPELSLSVTEDEISSAVLALIEKQKMVAEGAGAVSVAAAMYNKFPIAGKKVVSLISGGNIDVTSLSRVIERGLMRSARIVNLLIELADKPGQLKDVSRIIADCGGNVTGVHYERGGTKSVNGCFLRITLEARNYDHADEIVHALESEGFRIAER